MRTEPTFGKIMLPLIRPFGPPSSRERGEGKVAYIKPSCL